MIDISHDRITEVKVTSKTFLLLRDAYKEGYVTQWGFITNMTMAVTNGEIVGQFEMSLCSTEGCKK